VTLTNRLHRPTHIGFLGTSITSAGWVMGIEHLPRYRQASRWLSFRSQ
jgi:hypothetical protein